MSNIRFSKNLIKGKIAEIIFERMLTESGRFNILRSGYEYTYPELAQYPQLGFVEKYLTKIRQNPDFILISEDRKEAYIVEVKYRAKRDPEQILNIAERTKKLQDPSFLFIASPDGFFFEPCNTIIRNKGKIRPLYTKWVDKKTQDKYLKLMNKFKPRN
ncbi:MAG: hypothetical protein GF370_03660 [Candidatus Nealsonbacteria bacterium]|nr:hypothetical protein [Candidatus Nealsonbacteria bacterium]